VLPAEESLLREQLDKHAGKHARYLLELLNAEAQEKLSKTRKRKAVEQGRDDALVASSSSSLLDSTLCDSLDQASASKRNVKDIIKLLLSRDPVTSDWIGKLVDVVAKGDANPLEKAGQAVKAYGALAALCATRADIMASFLPVSKYIIKSIEEGNLSENSRYGGKTGTEACTQLVKDAVCTLGTFCKEDGFARDEDQSNDTSSIWTEWSNQRYDAMASYVLGAKACCDLVLLLIKLKGMKEEELMTSAEQVSAEISHVVSVVGPHAALGFLLYQGEDAKLVVSDSQFLIMFMACMRLGFSTGEEDMKAPCYMLCMKAARRAIQIAQRHKSSSLKSKLESSCGQLVPPLGIVDWLKSHPPSATIELLVQNSESGLEKISDTLISRVQDKEMQSLVFLSLLSLQGTTGAAQAAKDDATFASAMDDLFFFESKQGELNMLPEDWNEEEDDDFAIQLSKDDEIGSD
jgi:hypothetical protein